MLTAIWILGILILLLIVAGYWIWEKADTSGGGTGSIGYVVLFWLIVILDTIFTFTWLYLFLKWIFS